MRYSFLVGPIREVLKFSRHFNTKETANNLLSLCSHHRLPTTHNHNHSDQMGLYKKHVAIVGSSGGGGASQAGSDVYALLLALRRELARAEIGVVAVCLVDCEAPLDFAASDTASVLWTLNEKTQQIERAMEGTLDAVNGVAQRMDKRIAAMVVGDEPVRVHGLVSISSDPDAVNMTTFLAAAKAKIPIVGTGGTSLGKAAGEMGCTVVGNSGGSVSTTVQSKALSFTASLAATWGLVYDPTTPLPNFQGILGACLPAFVAVVLANKALQDLQGTRLLGWVLPPKETKAVLDVSGTLPIAVAVVTASQVAKMGETALLAGVVAGVLACGGGSAGGGTVLTGLVVGAMAGWLCRQVLVLTAKSLWVPATASSIVTAGASGLLAALVGKLAVAPLCTLAADVLHMALAWLERPPRGGDSVGAQQWLVAVLVGPAMTWGSQVGYYHLVWLPLILFEMERGQPSFLGAVDWCSLCLVSGGITAATVLLPLPDYHPSSRQAGDSKALAQRGAYTNLVWGDFVEACYPFFQGDWFLTAVVYLSSIVSTAWLLHDGCRSSAYLPAPVSLWLAMGAEEGTPSWRVWESKAWAAALVAFGGPFVATLTRSMLVRFTRWAGR